MKKKKTLKDEFIKKIQKLTIAVNNLTLKVQQWGLGIQLKRESKNLRKGKEQ